jgi:L-ascorbate metabolism protein UlaG (beta-lactamase superfamily)
MKLQLIRNATLKLHYGGRVILIDPYLGARHAYDSLVGTSRNPTVDLPCPVDDVIDGVEAVIVSHLHRDHFDQVAWERLPKAIPLFCQPGNEDTIAGKGFSAVQAIGNAVEWNGIHITRTPGQHGSGIWAERMGQVSGFVLRADGEPTVYWTGDTIWYEPVEQAITAYRPDIIVTHSCGAAFEANSPIVMNAEQTVAVCRAAPDATVVAVHMEALDHSTVTRAGLRAHADAQGITAQQLRIPDDGDTLEFQG